MLNQNLECRQKEEKNQSHTGLRALLFLLLCMFVVVVSIVVVFGYTSYVEDNWFMFKNAETIFDQGFIHTDVLTLHPGFHNLITQWLFAVMITVIRPLFGGYGLTILMIALSVLLFVVQYKNAKLIQKEARNQILFVFLSVCFFQLVASHIRPYVVTVCLSCLTLFCIEKWIASKNGKWLLGLPILSILQINFHNSLWVVLFLILLCYYGEWVMDALFHREHRFSLKPLFLGTIGTLLGGIVNPYGLEGITYIIQSLEALEPLKSHIVELLSPSFRKQYYFWIPFLLELIWFGIVLFRQKRRIPWAYLFLWAGFSLMSFWAVRNIIFFFTCGQMLLFYTAPWMPNLLGKGMTKTLLTFFPIACGLCFLLVGTPDQNKTEFHRDVDTFVAQLHPEGDTCFNTFDSGSYLEYKGLKAYIDTRAELFGKSVNGKKDVSEEYLQMLDPEQPAENVQAFVDTYQFDWLILDKDYNNIETFVQKVKGYTLVYDGEETLFYQRDGGKAS
ncbi:hypothetical protein [Faecalicoccus pleomorphus]|uniref:hypothetical protein n=1 Tax=Faecalicoccus pleomorphus TaxID=1323 RepID=UPI002943DD78|nr:hypothetical protein [Faecalicoccus pleomorphus]